MYAHERSWHFDAARREGWQRAHFERREVYSCEMEKCAQMGDESDHGTAHTATREAKILNNY